MLSAHLTDVPNCVDRFRHEVRLGQSLSHPNLVSALGGGIDAATRRPFLVMECVEGSSAHDLLRERGPLSAPAAARIVRDAARALEYLHHRDYCHRDVKPGNVLVRADGSATLADLGVAKHLGGDSDLTSVDQNIGTPDYMPWEQQLNAGMVDGRSDVFALGATFYHLVTGRPPFAGTSPAELFRAKQAGDYVPAGRLAPDLPPAVDDLLRRMLASDPRRRFRSATELVEALGASGLIDGTARPGTETLLNAGEEAPTRAAPEVAPVPAGPLWVVQYRIDDRWRSRRGTRRHVAEWHAAGLIPDDLYAVPPGEIALRPIRSLAEFRDLPRLVPAGRRERRPRRPCALALPVLPLVCLLAGAASVLATASAVALRLLCPSH